MGGEEPHDAGLLPEPRTEDVAASHADRGGSGARPGGRQIRRHSGHGMSSV